MPDPFWCSAIILRSRSTANAAAAGPSCRNSACVYENPCTHSNAVSTSLP
jgi:hypothetical protein